MALAQKKNPPLGIHYWRTQLVNQCIPILPNIGRDLLDQLKNPNISTHQLAQVIALDPILGIQVLKEANHLNHRNNKDTEIKNIDHSVSILGLDNIQRLAHRIPILNPAAEYGETKHYLSAVLCSLHAAAQAKSWATLRSHHAPQDIYLASLFYGVPIWYLWQYASAEMQAIHHLITQERVPALVAEKSVLGCTISELSSVLAKDWCLPETVIDAFNPRRYPDNRFLISTARSVSKTSFPELPAYDPKGVAINSAATQVLLANWLCRETNIDWNSRQTDRALKVVSAFIRLPLDDTRKLVIKNALQVSRHYAIPGILTPGARLLSPPEFSKRRAVKLAQVSELAASLVVKAGPNQIHKHLTAKEVLKNPELTHGFNWTKPSTSFLELDDQQTTHEHNHHPIKSELKNLTVDQALFKEFTENLRHHPEKYPDLNELLELASQALHYGLGLKRAVMMVCDKSNGKLQAKSSTGCKQNPELQYFTCTLNGSSVIQTLLKKPSSIWIKEDSLSGALKLLPQEFSTHCEVKEFFMMSLFRGDHPLGLCYVDRGPGGEGLRQQHYNAFKYLCHSVTQCLTAQQNLHQHNLN